jgi:hypothetical protein
VTSPDWRLKARCRDRTTRFFTSDEGFAKAVCALCPVWHECLTSLPADEQGVRAGLNRTDRARLARLLQRAKAVGLSHDDNGRDVRRIVKAGLAVDRLAIVLQVEPAALEPLLVAPPPRRRVRAGISTLETSS